MYKNQPQLYKPGTEKCVTEIDHNWLGLKPALSRAQMYKKQPQMYK